MAKKMQESDPLRDMHYIYTYMHILVGIDHIFDTLPYLDMYYIYILQLKVLNVNINQQRNAVNDGEMRRL
jgi:hypothetical protein